MTSDLTVPVRIGPAEVWTHLRAISARDIAVVLGIDIDEVRRSAAALGVDDVGIDGAVAYDPVASAEIVVDRVERGEAEPLALAVVRALFEGHLAAGDLTIGGRPRSAVALIRLVLQRNETARNGASLDVASCLRSRSIETKAWTR